MAYAYSQWLVVQSYFCWAIKVESYIYFTHTQSYGWCSNISCMEQKMHRCIADIVFQKMQRYGNGEIAFSDRKTPLPGYEIKAIASKLQQITLND